MLFLWATKQLNYKQITNRPIINFALFVNDKGACKL